MRISYDKMKLAAERNNDNNMCTVIALACVKNWTYEGAYAYAAKYGRKHGRGMVQYQITEMLGITYHDWTWTVSEYGKRVTAKTFARMNPTGKYYCLTRNHAIAIVDGVVQDWTAERKHQITHFVKVG